MNKKVKTTVWLGLPWLASIGGFFIPDLTTAVIVWIAALVAMAFNTLRAFFLCDEDKEADDEEMRSVLNDTLLFANMYVFGMAVMPFAIIGLILWGIYKGCLKISCWLVSTVRTHEEGIKCFFIPLVLNAVLWIIAFNHALTEPLWLKWTVFAANTLILCITGFYGIKLIIRNQKRARYLTLNGLALLISLSAAVSAIICPRLVSLDWCGLLLIAWLFLIIFTAFILSLLIWITTTVILWNKKRKRRK